MKKILITGGKGNFATNLSHFARKMNYSVLNPSKNEMDIRNYSNIDYYFHIKIITYEWWESSNYKF